MPYHIEEPNEQTQSLSPSELVLYSRLNNHLLFHFTPLIQFWQTQRLCVTLDEFEGMLERIGFYKGKQELYELRSCGVEFIGLDKLLIGVKQWKNSQGDIVTFMKKQEQYLTGKQREKHFEQKNEKRYSLYSNKRQSQSKHQAKQKTIVGSFHNSNYQQLKSDRVDFYGQQSKNTQSRATNKTARTTSQHFLKEASKKNYQALLDLNSTLIRTKNESQYQLAIKIGQLNDICKRLKNNFAYLIITKDNGDIEIIEKSNKTDSSKIISPKVFQKKYQELKLQSNNLIDEIEGTLEKDLRQTLVEVMYLSDQLENQIALLKRKGVNMS